jgi:hypothetical protein
MIDYLPLVLTGLGLAASMFYYARALYNANQTRKAQFILQITAWRQNPDGWKINHELSEMQWTDYEDFNKKYDAANNPEHAFRRNSFLYTLDTWGHLMKTANLDREMVYDIFGRGVVAIWDKFCPIFMEMRVSYFGNDDSYMKGFEYLYNEMMAVRKRRGITGKFHF